MAYKTIHDKFWTDPKIQSISPTEKLLYLYFITNPHTHFSGIYYLPKAIILEETGLSNRDIDRGIDRGIDKGILMIDKPLKLIFIKKMLYYQSNKGILNEKQKKGIKNHFENLHNSLLINEFIKIYPDIDITPIDTPMDTPMDTPTIGLSDQNTEYRIQNNTSSSFFLENFEKFWSAYPLKANKKKAREIWIKKVKPNEKKFSEIMSGLEKAKKSKQWKNEGGKYIPLPTTFLNGERWNDEFEIETNYTDEW